MRSFGDVDLREYAVTWFLENTERYMSLTMNRFKQSRK